MKKVALSAFVIFVFAAYVLHQKGEADLARVVPPNFIQATPSPISSQQAIQPTTGPSTSAGTPPTPIPTATPRLQTGKYRDGRYTGDVTDAFYGLVQVQVTISGGKITDVVFLQYPNDRQNSIFINSQAMPYLRQEAIQAQSASVDIISGATATSEAFIQSLQSALAKAT